MPHILHVEDEPAHAFLVKNALQQANESCRLTQVTDGESALDYLYRRNDFSVPGTSPRPDFILLDLRLPKIDGLEVLRNIKLNDETRCIPVIILTTSKSTQDIHKAYDYFANSYMVKPYEYKELVALLKHVTEYWLKCNQKYH